MEPNKEIQKTNSGHSNFRRGLSDYHDGENVTHHLGNDDYQEGANLPEKHEKEPFPFDGSVAGGNEDLEES
jgi:hypothetical protein